MIDWNDAELMVKKYGECPVMAVQGSHVLKQVNEKERILMILTEWEKVVVRQEKRFVLNDSGDDRMTFAKSRSRGSIGEEEWISNEELERVELKTRIPEGSELWEHRDPRVRVPYRLWRKHRGRSYQADGGCPIDGTIYLYYENGEKDKVWFS